MADRAVSHPSILGPLAAAGASILGGTAVVATRLAVKQIDPLLLAYLRYLIGAAFLLPFVLRAGRPRITREDLLPTALLGVIFFGAFPWSFSAALRYTTASHGALVLSTVPLLTFFLSGFMGTEVLTQKKLIGVTLAFLGVAFVLADKMAVAGSQGASVFGDLLMLGAAGCGAVYNVFSQPYLRKYPRLSVTVVSMLAGTAGLLVPTVTTGSLTSLHLVTSETWLLILFLGIFGVALSCVLLVSALELMTPTRVAVFITLNPLVAMSLGIALLGEPITSQVVLGFGCVFAGIGLAVRPPEQDTRRQSSSARVIARGRRYIPAALERVSTSEKTDEQEGC
jgi:drug/metabolite transporter (DMT)-like permease